MGIRKNTLEIRKKLKKFRKIKKIRKNTLENLVKELGKILRIRKNTPVNLEKYSRKLGKILRKIRKNTPQNQDPIVKNTFSNYAPLCPLFVENEKILLSAILMLGMN